MRPVFADPKTDFVFRKVFGTDEQAPLLVSLLNALMGLREAQAIVSLNHLLREQQPRIEEVRSGYAGVRVRTAGGAEGVVRMQVLQVEGFEKPGLFRPGTAYVREPDGAEDASSLSAVVAITLCDFLLWPEGLDGAEVPMVSWWRLKDPAEPTGWSSVQHLFVELPKLLRDREPLGEIEEWAYLFREGSRLAEVPGFLRSPGPREALNLLRRSQFTWDDWESYDRAKVAEQDARGALTFAKKEGLVEGKKEGKKEGLAEGEAKGKREAVLAIVTARGLTVSAAQSTVISTCLDLALLDTWIARAMSVSSVEVLLAPPQSTS